MTVIEFRSATTADSEVCFQLHKVPWAPSLIRPPRTGSGGCVVYRRRSRWRGERQVRRRGHAGRGPGASGPCCSAPGTWSGRRGHASYPHSHESGPRYPLNAVSPCLRAPSDPTSPRPELVGTTASRASGPDHSGPSLLQRWRTMEQTNEPPVASGAGVQASPTTAARSRRARTGTTTEEPTGAPASRNSESPSRVAALACQARLTAVSGEDRPVADLRGVGGPELGHGCRAGLLDDSLGSDEAAEGSRGACASGAVSITTQVRGRSVGQYQVRPRSIAGRWRRPAWVADRAACLPERARPVRDEYRAHAVISDVPGAARLRSPAGRGSKQAGSGLVRTLSVHVRGFTCACRESHPWL